MNHFFLNKTDSRSFRQNLVTWKFDAGADFTVIEKQEQEIIQKFQPAMISVFLPVQSVPAVHAFTKLGYEFMECRLLIEKELDGPVKSYTLYPYEFIEIISRRELKHLIAAFQDFAFDDRFFADPQIDDQLALNRNKFFLEQSLKRKNERVFVLQNSNSGELLGFRSFKLKNNTVVDMLISRFLQKKTNENIQELINLFELQLFNDLGVQKIHAVLSAKNYDEINRYLSKYAYTITDSKIVVRKILKSFLASN